MSDVIVSYFSSSNIIVTFVLVVLALASFFSWMIIFQRGFLINQARREVKRFEKRFWRTENLEELYKKYDKDDEHEGLSALFCAGYKEYLRLRKRAGMTSKEIIEGVHRAMRVTASYEEEELESGLPLLATIGSISPYIGLFGTVWGIMMSLHALSGVEQITIAMVAPGISEALIATAMGLFAAIPALIFYNRLINKTNRILNRYDAFQEEFISLLQHSMEPKAVLTASIEEGEIYA